MAPFPVVAVRIWLQRDRAFLPFADHALLELQLRDIWSHPPVLGVYSRVGWNHPGPFATYLLAGLYWLTGGASLWIAATAINASAALVIALVMIRRLGARAALVGSCLLAVYLAFLGPLGISDPWNPIVSILPFLAFVFCCWDAWWGGRWTWCAVVLFGTFAVQSHLQYAAPVVVLGSMALVGAWRAARARCAARSWWPIVLTVGGLGGALWALPVWDALARTSNIGRIIDYVGAGSGQQHSWRESAAMAARAVVAPITTIPVRSSFHLLLDWPPPARILVTLVILGCVAMLGFAILRRRFEAVSLLGLGGVGLLIAVIECSRMERELWPYLVARISTFFVVLWFGAFTTVLPDLRRVVRHTNQRIVVVCVVTASVWVGTSIVMAVAPWRPLHNTNVVGPLA